MASRNSRSYVDRQPVANDAKSLGAYYTNTQIAEFLVRWAVRSKNDRVIDPSFGGGVFLRAACQIISKLGGKPRAQIFGVELDGNVHGQICEKLVDEFEIRSTNLIRSDFFEVAPDRLGKLDTVVGNPPFIRYQRFSGCARELALRRAADLDVKLSKLTSSWAPFVVHATSFLKRGGRLAFVVPMEITYTSYSIPVLRFLEQTFGEITFLTFKKKLFPDLSEDTLLLLADGHGQGPAKIFTRDFHHGGMLRYQYFGENSCIIDRKIISTHSFVNGTRRLTDYFLPATIRNLYEEVEKTEFVSSLGALADVGIGYVTGNNAYFHLTPAEVERWHISPSYLRPAVRRGRSLSSLRFTIDDWKAGLERGESCFLLNFENAEPDEPNIRRYIKHGKAIGVSNAYKCRSRSPWYKVPHVYQPDAFLTYMSGDTPKLVANDTDAVAPNSLHVLRLFPDSRVSKYTLTALWYTSFTKLSSEINGHALGGGMLKLEPTEAERVLIALPNIEPNGLDEFAHELDRLSRIGKCGVARELADELILVNGLGLTRRECRLFAEGNDLLRTRRLYRGLPA